MKENISPKKEDSEIILRLSALVSVLSYLTTIPIVILPGLTGISELFDSHSFDRLIEATGADTFSMAHGIVRLRNMGFSDETIAYVFLGIAAIAAVGHRYAASEVNRLIKGQTIRL